MAAIHKRRARSFLTRGAVSSAGFQPGGVGGMPDSTPCVSFTIGEHTVFLTVKEYRKLRDDLDGLLPEDSAHG